MFAGNDGKGSFSANYQNPERILTLLFRKYLETTGFYHIIAT